MLTYMCLLTDFLVSIPIPDKSVETVIQAYLQHVYGTFSYSHPLNTDSCREIKNELF